MPVVGELLVLLVMLVGVVGTVVPVLPGLLLVWAAGVAWAWLDGGGAPRFTVAAVLTGLLLVGTVAKYVLPARSVRGQGAPRRTMLFGVLGAVAGFFVIPVVGAVVGGVGAIYLAEHARLSSRERAWQSTRAVLIGLGIGVAVEVTAGLTMVAVWLLAVLLI